MEMPKDYEQTQGFTGEYETIKLGGQVCKIKSAKVEKTKTDKDMLVITYDIAEGENKGYFERRFDADNRNEKKWGGVHRIMVLDNEGRCNKFFKGFTTSIEASNKGYKFKGDETTLKDKLFGAVFGREEYENTFGERKMATKIRYIRGIEGIENAEVPKDKMLPEKGEAFEDFINSVNSNNNEDLPF